MSTDNLIDQDRAAALGERILGGLIGAMDVATVYVGDQLGLYEALRSGGAATSAELAGTTGTHERSIREWLEQQAVTGILDVDDADAPAAERRYELPAELVEALTDADSLAFVPAFAQQMIGGLAPIAQLVEALRANGGVPYADYGKDMREGIGRANRVMFLNLMGTEWLPAVADVHERLTAGPARVADVACGTGWSSIAIARAYPGVSVDAFDVDEGSVADAKANVEAEGLAGRVSVSLHDASGANLRGSYDLVTIFEALHDMARPVEALENARGLLAEGASLIVADERVAERFAAPGDEIERLMYGFSVLHCLPVGLADHEHSEGTGTVMRIDTLKEYARRAGFGSVEVLPIENDFWRFYRLRP